MAEQDLAVGGQETEQTTSALSHLQTAFNHAVNMEWGKAAASLTEIFTAEALGSSITGAIAGLVTGNMFGAGGMGMIIGAVGGLLGGEALVDKIQGIQHEARDLGM